MTQKEPKNGCLYLYNMTRSDVESVLKKILKPVVLIAVGSVEQHGPHMALGRDSYGALDICERVAERTSSIIVHPTWLGLSSHHMGFKGTLTLKWETLLNVLVDTVTSLAHHGFSKIMFVNNHGGNKEVVALAAMVGHEMTNANVVTEPTFETSVPLVKEKRRRFLDIHAGATETSRMLAAKPHLVSVERLEGWTAPKLPECLLDLLNDPDDPYGFGFQIVKTYLPEAAAFTSSGIYGLCDPRELDLDAAKEEIRERVDHIVKYIELWKKVPDDLSWDASS